MPLAPSQRKLNPPASPSFCAGRKLGETEKALVWQFLRDNPQCPSRLLLDQVAQAHAPLDISVGHLNRLRRQWQLNRPKGRPRHAPVIGLRPPGLRSSSSSLDCLMSGGISLVIGSINTGPLTRL